jgi:hypothetical protein
MIPPLSTNAAPTKRAGIKNKFKIMPKAGCCPLHDLELTVYRKRL